MTNLFAKETVRYMFIACRRLLFIDKNPFIYQLPTRCRRSIEWPNWLKMKKSFLLPLPSLKCFMKSWHEVFCWTCHFKKSQLTLSRQIGHHTRGWRWKFAWPQFIEIFSNLPNCGHQVSSKLPPSPTDISCRSKYGGETKTGTTLLFNSCSETMWAADLSFVLKQR